MVQGGCPLCRPIGFKGNQGARNNQKRNFHRAVRRQTREDLEGELGKIRLTRPAFGMGYGGPWNPADDKRQARHRAKKRKLRYRHDERDAKYQLLVVEN